jgi:hypothetical protein
MSQVELKTGLDHQVIYIEYKLILSLFICPKFSFTDHRTLKTTSINQKSCNANE